MAYKQKMKRVLEIISTLSYYTVTNLNWSHKELVINDATHKNLEKRGLFSLFREVLDIISTNGQRDIRIKYYHTLYNDSPKDNMWEYYFYPVRNDVKKKYFLFFTKRPFRTLGEDKKQLVLFNEIITDRIRVKEYILNKVEKFWKENLAGKKVIAVHYRGTDIYRPKQKDFKKAKVEECFDEIDALLAEGYEAIFLATDEESILEKFKDRYGSILFYSDIKRSHDGQALHLSGPNRREPGETAMIDVLLLSKCDFFLYGDTNLSVVARMFNPNMNAKNMDVKYYNL